VSTREGTIVSSSLIRRLLPLSLALFAVGTDGFVIAGLLPAIARDLGVDIPAAGQLVTAFALAFAVSAPVLGAATSALDRRATMLIGLAGFSVGNALTALGPTYPVVLGARVFTALGAGLIGAAAFSTAAAIAPPERQGRALATVMGGLSISMALGLPAGTLIGSADWRVTLWAVTAIGLVAAAGVAFGVPVVSLPSTSLRTRLRPLRETSVLGMLATACRGNSAPTQRDFANPLSPRAVRDGMISDRARNPTHRSMLPNWSRHRESLAPLITSTGREPVAIQP
jgi:DHA1 family inner membrane transport protein